MLQDAMTKPSQSPLHRDADVRQRGRKVGEVHTSLAAFAVRDALSHEEEKTELEGWPAAGWCDIKRLPDNPQTKFRIEVLASLELPGRVKASSAFARWVSSPRVRNNPEVRAFRFRYEVALFMME